MPFENKMDALKIGLKEINKGLPANVYIPFVTQSIRNHAVLRIFEEESRIFVTRQRAPYMICVELYRPEEENKYNQMLLKKQSTSGGERSIMDRLKSLKSVSISKIVQ